MSVKNPENFLRKDVHSLLELAKERGITHYIPHFVGYCAIGTAATFIPEMPVAEALRIIEDEFRKAWKQEGEP